MGLRPMMSNRFLLDRRSNRLGSASLDGALWRGFTLALPILSYQTNFDRQIKYSSSAYVHVALITTLIASLSTALPATRLRDACRWLQSTDASSCARAIASQHTETLQSISEQRYGWGGHITWHSMLVQSARTHAPSLSWAPLPSPDMVAASTDERSEAGRQWPHIRGTVATARYLHVEYKGLYFE